MFLIIVLFIYHVKLYEAIEQDDALKIFIFKTLIELDCLITLVIIYRYWFIYTEFIKWAKISRKTFEDLYKSTLRYGSTPDKEVVFAKRRLFDKIYMSRQK